MNAFYYNPNHHPVSTISDMEEVLNCWKYELIDFDTETDINMYDCLSFPEFERGINTLIEVFKEIGAEKGEKYRHTIIILVIYLFIVKLQNQVVDQ